MADPLSLTGTALAVVSLLYSSCRSISDVIDHYKKAPKEYADISQDIKALLLALDSLKGCLGVTHDSDLSDAQKATLADLTEPLHNCNEACTDFANKISSLTSHSNEDHTSRWDRLRLHFNKSDVALLREKLNTTKTTLQIATSVSTLKALSRNEAQLTDFQEMTTTIMSTWTGKLEALSLTLEAMSSSTVAIRPQHVEAVQKTLKNHGQLLQQCVQLCTDAIAAVHVSDSRTQVRHAKALDRARQVIGNLGPIMAEAPSVSVDIAEASGGAFQGIGNLNLNNANPDVLRFLAGN
ncbi:hypothetical protein E8E14_010545 [Neopestalotiopsis sp. 37M]|nr:hypothetical protein E8E14_010545 [Neopestalotiopsis sp. 37M]